MAVTFEKKPLEWLATGIEPPEELRIKGFEAGYKPPADYFNYKFKSDYDAIIELQEKINGLPITATREVIFDGALSYTNTEASELLKPITDYQFISLEFMYSSTTNLISIGVFLVANILETIEAKGNCYLPMINNSGDFKVAGAGIVFTGATIKAAGWSNNRVVTTGINFTA